MNILLDECVPWPLYKLLAAHTCKTAQQCGWGGIKNGELLARAQQSFELFITSDQNMRYQQNLANRPMAILMLSTNKWRMILASKDLIESAVSSIQSGEFRYLDIPYAP